MNTTADYVYDECSNPKCHKLIIDLIPYVEWENGVKIFYCSDACYYYAYFYRKDGKDIEKWHESMYNKIEKFLEEKEKKLNKFIITSIKSTE